MNFETYASRIRLSYAPQGRTLFVIDLESWREFRHPRHVDGAADPDRLDKISPLEAPARSLREPRFVAPGAASELSHIKGVETGRKVRARPASVAKP
jgi:hypothetical protein